MILILQNDRHDNPTFMFIYNVSCILNHMGLLTAAYSVKYTSVTEHMLAVTRPNVLKGGTVIHS